MHLHTTTHQMHLHTTTRCTCTQPPDAPAHNHQIDAPAHNHQIDAPAHNHQMHLHTTTPASIPQKKAGKPFRREPQFRNLSLEPLQSAALPLPSVLLDSHGQGPPWEPCLVFLGNTEDEHHSHRPVLLLLLLLMQGGPWNTIACPDQGIRMGHTMAHHHLHATATPSPTCC
jgi:hypothetical protein